MPTTSLALRATSAAVATRRRGSRYHRSKYALSYALTGVTAGRRAGVERRATAAKPSGGLDEIRARFLRARHGEDPRRLADHARHDRVDEELARLQPGLLEEQKLVLVVRTDLGMTKGKIAAQCSHATLACFKTLQKAKIGRAHV